ncbi:DUF721 domain-containing protein [Candidatus Bipolaricaulota bacterium]|nr:DUF721 domain-containing protein [Candidatus Bipolaricaulota bacterium]
MKAKDIWQWLGPLARSWGAEEELQAQLPILHWSSTGLSHLARPLYVDRGALHLVVDSHVVASELNLLKEKVLARLEEVAPGCGVVDLRFQVRAHGAPREEIAVPPPAADEVRAAREEVPKGLPTTLAAVCARLIAWARARERAILTAGGWRCPGCGVVLAAEESTCRSCAIERPPPRR